MVIPRNRYPDPHGPLVRADDAPKKGVLGIEIADFGRIEMTGIYGYSKAAVECFRKGGIGRWSM